MSQNRNWIPPHVRLSVGFAVKNQPKRGLNKSWTHHILDSSKHMGNEAEWSSS